MPRTRKVKSVEVLPPEPPTWRVRVVSVLPKLGLTLVLLGLLSGFAAWAVHIVNKLPPNGPVQVTLLDPPAWMHPTLVRAIERSIEVPTDAPATDAGVLEAAVRTLNSNAWVKQVREIRRVYNDGPGRKITIACDFRAPAAIVQSGADFWLIDATGIKLPERYGPGDLPSIQFTPHGTPNLRLITGVVTPAPPIGQPWQSPDLSAAMDLIALLQDKSFADDITELDVSNFNGRVRFNEAQIVMRTRQATEIRWGRPVQARDFFVEPAPAHKLAQLEKLYQHFGRADAGKPWIDLRLDIPTHPFDQTATVKE